MQFIAVDGTDSYTGAVDEVALDVENGHGVAAGSHVKYFLGCTCNSNGILDAESAAVNDASSTVISNSWGYSANNDDVTDPVFEAVLQQGAALGKSNFFSTGDTSQITYPATSPNVVAVGGTSLGTDASNNWSSESTWSAGGRGCSAVQPRPSWQVGITGSCTGRAEPDISADADPNTGAWTCFNGGCFEYGGTSLSAPLWAGMTADWNSSIHAADNGVGVGFLAPLLYKSSPNCSFQTLTTSITSSPSNTIEQWPGGQATMGSGGCTVTVNRPSGDIDLIGGTVGVDSWSIASVNGFSTVKMVVNTPDCESLGASGSVTQNRPTCSNASTVFENDHSHDSITITTSPYHDVTTGCTGGVCAGAGWDNATGWGSPIFSQLVNAKVPQTINFPTIAAHAFGDAPFSVSATSSSGLTVSITSATTGVCTVSGTTVTIVAVGTCTLNANQAGDSKYFAATQAQRSFTVNKASQTITFAAIAKQKLPHAPLTISPTATSGLPVTVTSNTPTLCTVSSNSVTLLNPGICSLTANQAGNANYLAASPVIRTFDITTPNVIRDGSFETPAEPPGSGVEFGVGQHIGPWDVTQATVDLTSTYWQNADGAQSLDLAGLAPGAVSQTFTLQYTGAYTVKFQFAGNMGGAPVKKHMTVTANSPSWGSPVSVSKVFDTTGLSTVNMGWKKGKLAFAGVAGQVVTVNFTDTDAGNTPYGMVIDAVAANAK